ncbi:hypothetical protein [Streptomyces sp. NK08204]|uniref:hypothetical protein n=1 Tax=Streptomyces sp. NK08204 TaxID=2873260 RepID=UPI001CEC7910|nr:hypothetical protein [Streptomyces sp. NK08204]
MPAVLAVVAGGYFALPTLVAAPEPNSRPPEGALGRTALAGAWGISLDEDRPLLSSRLDLVRGATVVTAARDAI